MAFSEERTAESARNHDSLPSPVSIRRRSWPVPITYVFVPKTFHYHRLCKRWATGLPWRVNCVILLLIAVKETTGCIPFLDCQPKYVSPRSSDAQLLQVLLTGLSWREYAIIC